MTNRIQLLNQNEASEQSQKLLTQVQQKFGSIPNVFKMMANSSAVLESYLNFSGALAQGKLDPKIAERIALLISQDNDCEYCISAHSAIARNAGLPGEEILGARQGGSSDEKADAALVFAIAVADNSGRVEEEDFQNAKKAGFSDEELLEIIAVIALTNLTNTLNNFAQTEVDFPKVPVLKSCGCGCSHSH